MLAEPRPRSEAQREAARRNGARSRGPVTAEGKARAARNAFRHGLKAATLLAPGEDPAEFAALLADLRAEYAPADTTAELLVQRLAVTLWKLARCDRLEAGLAACRPRPPAGRVYPDGTPVLLTRTAELATLSAHAARLERAMHRLLAALADHPRAAAAETARAGAALESTNPAPDRADSAPKVGAAGSPAGTETRANEPEPLVPPVPSPAARPTMAELRPGPAEPPAAGSPAAPETRANEPEPATAPQPVAADEPAAARIDIDPALLVRARSDPDLAVEIAEAIARRGDLRGFERFARALGPDPARAPGPIRSAA